MGQARLKVERKDYDYRLNECVLLTISGNSILTAYSIFYLAILPGGTASNFHGWGKKRTKKIASNT